MRKETWRIVCPGRVSARVGVEVAAGAPEGYVRARLLNIVDGWDRAVRQAGGAGPPLSRVRLRRVG